MDKKKGALDALLAPLGQNMVNPGGQVTAMMNGDYANSAAAAQALKDEEERKRLAALAAEKSAMEAAATQPREVSGWNPFVWLFGQPGKPGGLLGGE